MRIHIDNDKFETAHEIFKQHLLQQSDGVPFTDFDHPFLVDEEVSYKWRVYNEARLVLNLNKWYQWKKMPGKIIQATKDACKASFNLLDHRHGPQGYSGSALYRVNELEQIKA